MYNTDSWGNQLPPLTAQLPIAQKFDQVSQHVASSLINTQEAQAIQQISQIDYKEFNTQSVLASVRQDKLSVEASRRNKKGPVHIQKGLSFSGEPQLQPPLLKQKQLSTNQLINPSQLRQLSNVSLPKQPPLNKRVNELCKIQLTGQRLGVTNSQVQSFDYRSHSFENTNHHTFQGQSAQHSGKPPLMPPSIPSSAPANQFNQMACFSPPTSQAQKTDIFMNDQQSQPQRQNYIYDVLFVQVSQQVFEREFQNRLRLNCPAMVISDEDQTEIEMHQQSAAQPACLQQVEQYALESQFPHLKVVGPKLNTSAFRVPRTITSDDNLSSHSDEEQEPLKVTEILQAAILGLKETGKKFKVTLKKNYINDVLASAKSSLTLAPKIYLVISDTKKLSTMTNTHPCQASAKKILRTDVSLRRKHDEISSRLPPQCDSTNISDAEEKKTPLTSKTKRIAEPSDDQFEKSVDSTTTSSTAIIQMNIKMRKTLQESNNNTPKNSQLQNLFKMRGTEHQRKTSVSQENHYSSASSEPPLIEKKEKQYGQAKIKIWHEWDVSELKQNPVQVMLDCYSEFVKIVFTQRHIYEQQFKQKLPHLLKLAKKMGLPLLRGQLQPANLKARENSNQLKEKIFWCWCRTLRESNLYEPEVSFSIFSKKLNENTRVALEQEQASLAPHYQHLYLPQKAGEVLTPADKSQSFNFHYKGYVQRGNNGQLVKSLFKCRYWWLLHDKEEIEKVNFMWTQCRKQEIMKTFKTKLIAAKGLDSNNPNYIRRRKNTGINQYLLGGNQSLDSKQSSSKEQHQRQSSYEETGVQIGQAQASNGQTGQTARIEQFPVKIYNKVEDNYHLSNKKALFLNMMFYYEAIGQDPFIALPMTFHVKSGLDDSEFQRFRAQYEVCKREKAPNVWIVKPGENTNRGQGISVAKDYNELKGLIEESTRSKRRTCIVQKYISNPLLINRRKFDIRVFALVTSINGNMKAYFYEEGYLRTSSREFSMNNLSNKLVHLCNDAIQKQAQDYGKYECGNKMSYVELQAYLDKNHTSLEVSVERDLIPQMKKLTSDCIKASWGRMDPNKRVNTFELFGLDFMLNDEFKPFLIEVNTNPCLELSSPLISRLIPNMLENVFRIAADPIFPPPEGWSLKKQVVHEICPENKFSLIFDEKQHGPVLEKLFTTKDNIIVEIDEDEISDYELQE